MEYEYVLIYRHKRLGHHVVEPYVRYRGASYAWGERIEVQPNELNSRLVPVILESLASYSRKTYEPERAPRHSDEEFSLFRREHRAVGITRYTDGRIEVMPHARKGHDYVGFKEDSILLEARASAEDFLKAIHVAFERASD